MLKLSVTPKAEADIIGVWVYTREEWGVDQADKCLDHLEEGMRQLVNHALLGADYAHVLPGYRRLQAEHHAVFYKVVEPEVLVIRVLHDSMDAPARLLD
ncbi:MAG: type II toxin-antitoxin system RelE/ParE family toxin [Nitrosospira sp.]|nr:type II toxin-antitoxin system RelE/ParE family toxin [Nitrosospira sp.]